MSQNADKILRKRKEDPNKIDFSEFRKAKIEKKDFNKDKKTRNPKRHSPNKSNKSS